MIPTRMFPLNIVGTFLEDNVPIGRDFKERDDEVLCNVVYNESVMVWFTSLIMEGIWEKILFYFRCKARGK